jgi:hypothetical protein
MMNQYIPNHSTCSQDMTSLPPDQQRRLVVVRLGKATKRPELTIESPGLEHGCINAFQAIGKCSHDMTTLPRDQQ